MKVQWRLSDITEQISKIAPQRPGLQHGYHGDPTTGTINSLSAPNLVQLEQHQKEDRLMEKGEKRRREGKKEQDEFVLCARRKEEGSQTGLYHLSEEINFLKIKPI